MGLAWEALFVHKALPCLLPALPKLPSHLSQPPFSLHFSFQSILFPPCISCSCSLPLPALLCPYVPSIAIASEEFLLTTKPWTLTILAFCNWNTSQKTVTKGPLGEVAGLAPASGECSLRNYKRTGMPPKPGSFPGKSHCIKENFVGHLTVCSGGDASVTSRWHFKSWSDLRTWYPRLKHCSHWPSVKV